MIYIEAPNYAEDSNDTIPKVFLGGGITNCKDWQLDLVQEIDDLDCIVYNPRRKSFDLKDPTQSALQIRWEHLYLEISDIVIFYFSSETLCPITLFELGARLTANQCGNNQSVYIYCEPNYQRKFDVEFQTKLAQEKFINILAERYKNEEKQNPELSFLREKVENMKREGPQRYGYDICYFDNYDRFVLTLCERIRKGK